MPINNTMLWFSLLSCNISQKRCKISNDESELQMYCDSSDLTGYLPYNEQPHTQKRTVGKTCVRSVAPRNYFAHLKNSL